MKCIYCGNEESKVIDSRSVEESNSIKRRRECLKCGKRFTTFETIEVTPVLVVKNNGIEAGRVTLTKDNLVNETVNQWSGKIGNLYRYDENGNEITYTLEEEIDSNFYQAEKESVVVEDKQASITNNFVIPEDKVEVTVTKIWNDNNNMYGRRPESVYLTITGNGITNKIEVNENLNWQATFKNLPKYDSNGQEIEYIAGIEEVNEGDLKFYSQEITTGNMEEGYEIKFGKIIVSKV